MPKSLRLLFAMVLVIVLALGFAGGYYASNRLNPPPSGELDIVEEAWQKLLNNYVEPDKLKSSNITASAVRGILAAVNDRHMSYLTAQDFNIVQSNMEGSFEGIGATVGIRDGKFTIIAPMKDSPAEKAGIKTGDVVTAIDGENAIGMALDVAISKIRGPSGTPVTLTIIHEGETEPVDIKIIRGKIDVPSLEFEMRGDIALITIYQFTSRTEDEFSDILPKLKQENAQGIILDLRGNPGGLLNIVVEVASHFVTGGVIVSVKSREGVVSTYDAKKTTTTELPTVVLVDENSASGSEVLSGALQDQHRAIIAGNVTYGKGSVNVLFPLSDGSGIYVTTARWLTPDGRMIEGNGIEPDIRLEMTGEDAIEWAIDYLKGL